MVNVNCEINCFLTEKEMWEKLDGKAVKLFCVGQNEMVKLLVAYDLEYGQFYILGEIEEVG